MPVFNNILAGAAGSGGAAGFKIDRSLRFNSGDSAHLVKDFATAGNQQKMTFSFWIKRNDVSSADESMIIGGDYLTSPSNAVVDRSLSMHFTSGQLKIYDYGASNGPGNSGLLAEWTPGSVGNGRLFRDPSAWYHCVFAIDTTQATAANRCKVWINGEQETFSNPPPQNAYLSWGQVRKHYIGIQKVNGSFTRAANFQLSEFHFIDGQQLAETDFGEYDSNSVWQPKEFTGDYNHAGSSGSTNYTNISTLAALSGSSIDSSYNDVSKVFDGSGTGVRTVAEASNQGEKLSITFSPAITLSNETVSIDTSSTYQGMFVTVDGSDGSRVSGSDSNTSTLTTGSLSGSLSKITVDNGTDTSGRPASVLRIRIGGSVLLDPGSGAGVNGFHLDFSDSSSNAALGTDSSGNGTTLPGVSFDGTGDNLSLALASGGLGSGDFTLEYFFYQNTLTNYQTHFGSTRGANGFNIGTQAAGNVVFVDQGGSGIQLDTGPGGVAVGRWYHVAFVRSGTTITGYLDGVSFGTYTSNIDYSATTSTIGSIESNTEYTNGLISNFRIVVGTAVYTSNFTRPTAPLSNITNTMLLCCQSSSSATAALGTAGSITANGDAFATSKDDSDWTVNNLSASDGAAVTVSAAAGALPIRNTTGDQGGTAASGVRTDSYASNLYLALPLNTNTSDVSNSINSSSTTKSTTNQSTATSSSQSRFYGASSYWNANSDGILVAESGSELVVGTGDFTIEFWFYDDSNHSGTGGRCYLFDNRIGGSVVGDPPTIIGRVDGSSTITYESSGGGGISHSLSTDNKWIHFAAVRNSGTTTLYINGTSVGSHSDTTNYTNNGIGIGRATDANYGWAGYIMDFRVYKTAKYTSNFSIPAEANPTVGAACDSLIDSPTNYEADSGNNGGNYCTMNPLAKTSTHTLSNGNLTSGTSSGASACLGTMAFPKTGKWYYEAVFSSAPGFNHIGIATANCNTMTVLGANPGYDTTNEFTYWENGSKTNDVAYGASFTGGDVIGIAFDADAGSLVFYKNGVSQGTNATGLTGTYFPFIPGHASFTTEVNFGQRPFSHPVSGYKSLCTQNLDDPTIADPSTAFDTALWAGTGSSNPITSLNTAPDLVWIKSRNSTGHHTLVDAVRGPTKAVFSNRSVGEVTDAGYLSSFDPNGFTVVSDNDVNGSGYNYVGFAWDAGSSNTSISAGSLNSSVYNQSATWTNDLTTNSGTSWFGGAAANAFDGSTSTFVQGAVGYDVTFTPTTGIAVANSMRIWADSGSGFGVGNGPYTITYNGTQVYSGSMWSSPYTITAAAGTTFSSLVIAPSGGEAMRLFAVEIDGKLLVNSGASVANVPSIASTCRANQTAGFSIITYTGTGSNATIGHGLNAAPGLVIVKKRSAAGSWTVWHEAFGTASNTDYIYLDSTGQQAQNGSDAQPFWNNTVPTSNVVNLGTGGNVNGSSATFVAYCFAPVAGYSAFGSYTGNGSADGPFIYTGFRPKFILRKQTNAAQHWHIVDTERDPENVADSWLFPNLSDAEGSGESDRNIDLLSNGFKIRSAYTYHNQNNSTYIYVAFAEHPQKTSRAR